jgi:hypothetical protein
LVPELKKCFSLEQVAPTTEENSKETNLWCDFGFLFLAQGRPYEALGIFEALYQRMLDYQIQEGKRVHKGLPLFRMGDCHEMLGRPVHTKRCLMLTLLEDAITGEGKVKLDRTGSYHRLVWRYGLSHEQVMSYAEKCWKLFNGNKDDGAHPEWVLQHLDPEWMWMVEVPPAQEAGVYCVSRHYCERLLGRLGTDEGRSLEYLAQYLVSCVPGCRAYLRKNTPSSDYDVVGVFEGPLVDFRSEFGRYSVGECKDHADPADFSDIAKFCRVLDSTKAKFGILFSKNGITGQGRRTDADLERLKAYQDRGIVIVVVDLDDLKKIAGGTNFISMLREKYMVVRLNLEEAPSKAPKKKAPKKKPPPKK